MTLYNHFIHSKNVKRLISEEAKSSKVLAYITALKKLCNHPKLGEVSSENADSVKIWKLATRAVESLIDGTDERWVC